MTRMIHALALGAAVAAATGPAFAGSLDDAVIAPAPAPVAIAPAPVPVTYGNDWSGFYAGANLGYGQVETDAFGDVAEDMTYGVHGGYLYDMGSIVIGGELEYDVTDIVDDESGIALDSVARAKLRAGYDAGNLLPYITIGAAQATTSGGLEADDTGAFAGLGVDYQVGQNIRVGAEVLQHQFEDFGGSGADIDATTASVRVGFTF